MICRSTKWVTNINILPEPSMGPVQRQEYLYYTQQVRRHVDVREKVPH
jgi:hypothetical protein